MTRSCVTSLILTLTFSQASLALRLPSQVDLPIEAKDQEHTKWLSKGQEHTQPSSLAESGETTCVYQWTLVSQTMWKKLAGGGFGPRTCEASTLGQFFAQSPGFFESDIAPDPTIATHSLNGYLKWWIDTEYPGGICHALEGSSWNLLHDTEYPGGICDFDPNSGRNSWDSKNQEVLRCDCLTPGADKADASGDPHVTNHKGDKFDIVQTGAVPLIKISNENTVLLEVTGLVERFGTACNSMFFTDITFDGEWVNNKLVTVRASNGAHTFSMIVDGQPVTLPFGRNTTAEKGKQAVLDARGEKLPFEKFVPSYISSESDPHQIRFEGHGNNDGINIHIKERSRGMSMNRGFLNFFMNGLDKLKGNKIGGVLGDDDYSEWTVTDETCLKNPKEDFISMSLDGSDKAGHLSLTGSIASASK